MGAELTLHRAADPTAPPAPAIDQGAVLVEILRSLVTILETQQDGAAAAMVDSAGLARLLGVGGRTLKRLRAAGKLPTPTLLGGAKKLPRWSVEELRHWVRSGCPTQAVWNDLKIHEMAPRRR